MRNTLTISIETQVPFYDVDSYQIVWHGNYPKYFEAARCALLEHIAYSYQQMEESGYLFPVIDLQVRYIKPLVYQQRICVQATLKKWQNKLQITYLITDLATGERLTKGSTTQVAVSMPDRITQFVSPSILLEKIKTRLDSV